MNRYLTLSVFVIIYSFYCHHFDNQTQAINDHQIILDDNQTSDYPIDDNGKLKDINVSPQTVFELVILSITILFGLFVAFTRRLRLITTIFYQSNYLINSLK